MIKMLLKILLFILILGISIFAFVDYVYILSPISLNLTNVKGEVYLVTGTTNGIGVETVKGLAKMNATVIMAVRDGNKAIEVRENILKQLKDEKVPHSSNIIIKSGLDLSTLEKVRSFVNTLNDIPAIDCLINNAGATVVETIPTSERIEFVFATNHLGPYLLTRLLEPKLIEASKLSGKKSKVVFLSSIMLFLGNADDRQYTFENKGFNSRNPLQSYSDSKLFNAMISMELNEYYKANSIHIVSNSVSPGYVVSNLDHNLPYPANKIALAFRKAVARPTEDGAIATLTVATSPKLLNKGGYHFEDWCIMDMCTSCLLCNGFDMGVKILPSGRDEKKRQWLWDLSNKFVGIQ